MPEVKKKVSDDERKSYQELQKRIAEEEAELKEVQEAEENADKEKRRLLKEGDKQGAKEETTRKETLLVSESTVQALLDELVRSRAAMEAMMRERGVPDAEIAQIRTMRFGRRQ